MINKVTKKSIQVDMFDVQLGAAMLMQFRLASGEIVRILADAGVDKASGYKIDHVLSKLFESGGSATGVWTDFDTTAEPRLNLIIGTHYDADHLRGLVPIIDHHALQIDEIWLPPVQDDQADVSANSVSGGNANLAQRLLDDDGSTIICKYLHNKAQRIQEVDGIYQDLATQEGRLQELNLTDRNETIPVPEFKPNYWNSERAIHYFDWHIRVANRTLGIRDDEDHHAHDDDEQQEFDTLQVALDDNVQRWQYAMARHWRNRRPFSSRLDVFNDALAIGLIAHGTQPPEFLALANIRKSLAKDAITAIHLDEVVKAIRARNTAGVTPAIRIRCETISEGQPRYFFWDKNRFRGGHPTAKKGELGFHLLGPSAQLVAKLQQKIPVGLMMIAYSDKGLKSGSVRPSNRLSYVMRFHLNDEAILISGDAGFSDFSPSGTTHFYPDLLAQLKSLQVVQVAHHGGINHRFYQALYAADLPKQTSWCFLLLSHAENDKTRPRAEFGHFADLFRWDQRDDVSVLFTSQPMPVKVMAFDDLVHPPVLPSGKLVAKRGDVRLGFPFTPDSTRPNTSWRVEAHAIKV